MKELTMTEQRAQCASILQNFRAVIKKHRGTSAHIGAVHLAKTYQAFIRMKGWQKGTAPKRYRTAECPACTAEVLLTPSVNDSGHVTCPICETLFTLEEA